MDIISNIKVIYTCINNKTENNKIYYNFFGLYKKFVYLLYNFFIILNKNRY